MEQSKVRITIDENGQVRREIIEQPAKETKRPSLLTRITTALSIQSVPGEEH